LADRRDERRGEPMRKLATILVNILRSLLSRPVPRPVHLHVRSSRRPNGS
jgi:hypothetical protein